MKNYLHFYNIFRIVVYGVNRTCAVIRRCSGEAECCKHPTESLHWPYTQLPVKDVYSAPRLPETTLHLSHLHRCLNACQFWQHEAPVSSNIFSFAHLSFWRLEVIPWDDIDEEVELVKLGDGHGDVISLENRMKTKSSSPITNYHTISLLTFLLTSIL